MGKSIKIIDWSPDGIYLPQMEAPDFLYPDYVLGLAPGPEFSTEKDSSNLRKARRLIIPLYDARKKPLADHLTRLETNVPVHFEVLEYILARLDRLESRLQATMMTNQTFIDSISTLRFDEQNILDHQSSWPNRATNIPDTTTLILPTTKRTRAPSTEIRRTISLRA